MSENNNTSLEVGKQVFESKDTQLSAQQIMAQVQLIDWVKNNVMIKGTHYDKPFGTSKKETLLKAGAEKLLMTFRINAVPEIEDLSTPDEVKYRIITRAYHIGTGKLLGTGIGVCSSNEEKYKWRLSDCQEEWDETDPERRRKKWKSGESILQVRTNLADAENTVVKMADKRSYVAVTLKVTAASDMFDQDLEDMDDDDNKKPSQKKTSGTPTSSGTEGNFHIKNWTSKSGGPPEKPWVRFTITTEEGASFTTFSESHKDEALRLKNAGLLAHIVWKKTQYGNDLVSIAQGKEPEPAPQPAAAPTQNNTQSAPPPNDDDLPPEMRKGFRG